MCLYGQIMHDRNIHFPFLELFVSLAMTSPTNQVHITIAIKADTWPKKHWPQKNRKRIIVAKAESLFCSVVWAFSLKTEVNETTRMKDNEVGVDQGPDLPPASSDH